MDVAGRVLAKARLPEGIAGMTRLHVMVAEQLGDDAADDEAQVLVGIETDRGRGWPRWPRPGMRCSR